MKEKVVSLGVSVVLLATVLLLVSYSTFDTGTHGRFALQSLALAFFPIGFVVLLDRLYFGGKLTEIYKSHLSET